jgi:hypothetical protein
VSVDTSFVSPRAVPALANAEQIAGTLSRWPQVTWSALVASSRGTARALAAGVTHLERRRPATPPGRCGVDAPLTGEVPAICAPSVRTMHWHWSRCCQDVVYRYAWMLVVGGRVVGRDAGRMPEFPATVPMSRSTCSQRSLPEISLVSLMRTSFSSLRRAVSACAKK